MDVNSGPLIVGFIVFIVVLAICKYFGFTFGLKASSQSTEFILENRATARKCPNFFVPHNELLTNPNPPVPGDFIEFDRYRGIYNHWGVFVGEGSNFIVHFTVNPEYPKGIVLKETLDEVSHGGNCRVNNLESVVMVDPEIPKSEICSTALDFVGQELVWDLLEFNCEHFVTGCALGFENKISTQALNARSKGSIENIGNFIGSKISTVLEQK